MQLILTHDLDQLKAGLHAIVDEAAGQVRGIFITTVPGQEMIYLQKRREAELILADPQQGANVPDAETTHVTAEALRHGVTRFEKAVEIITMAYQWAYVSAPIEDLRLAAKEAITNATTAAAAEAAANVDWSAILALRPPT